jgi:hypothetical protein
MYHNEDLVEEIATGRQGKLTHIGSSITGNVETQTSRGVTFQDGKQPPLRHFTNPDEIRLVKCPHSEPEGGFYPAEPLIR